MAHDLLLCISDHGEMPDPVPPSPGCDACASRDVVIEELIAANAALAERVAALERAAGRNSGNSGMPPSADDLPGRRKPLGRPGKGFGTQARQAARCTGQFAAVGGAP